MAKHRVCSHCFIGVIPQPTPTKEYGRVTEGPKEPQFRHKSLVDDHRNPFCGRAYIPESETRWISSADEDRFVRSISDAD